MKIIIAGAGNVGRKLVEQLSQEEHNVVVVDEDASLIENILDSNDVMGIVGNCVNGEVLINAGIKTADLLIACTHYDEMNILCCMVARKLCSIDTIARVRNPEYFSIFKDGDHGGLTMLVNPEYETAMEISRILKYPFAKKVEPFAGGKVDLVEFVVKEDSSLNGAKLKDLGKIFGKKMLVCIVSRNGKIHIPGGDFTLEPNDDICITASTEDIVSIFKQIGMPRRAKKIMIIGGGRTSYYLAKELKDVKKSTSIKIVDEDEKRCSTLDENLDKCEVICGDPTDQDLLMDEGLPRVDAFVTLDDSDERNVITAIYANKIGVKKVIAKIEKAAYFGMLAGRSSASIVSICNSTVNEIVRYVRSRENHGDTSSVKKVYRMMDGKAELVEFSISIGFYGSNTPLKELHIKKDVLICAIVRDDALLIPGGDDVIKPHDTVVVVAMSESISDINDILE